MNSTVEPDSNNTATPPPHAETECLNFVPVPRGFINVASLPALALVILISFAIKRTRLCPGCCRGRPGILIPMNLIRGKSSRVALAAGFAILTSRLMRLVKGDDYWKFPGMEDPEYADKLSILKILIKIINSVQLSMCFYPMFVCIIHRQYVFLNILGFLTMVPWLYYTEEVIHICILDPDATRDNLIILVLAELPEFIAFAYLIFFFFKCLYINIYRKRRCCKCEHGAFNIERDDGGREPMCMVYVRALLKRKPRKVTGIFATIKEALTYRKIPGLRSSPRILITITVASLAVYSLTWSTFRIGYHLESFLRNTVKKIGDIIGVDPEVFIHKDLIEDFILGAVYGAYACSFAAMVLEFLCLWRVYVNYRASVQLLLRGDKSVYKDVAIEPANMMVYASKYPGFQIAFTIYGYTVTFILLFIVVVVIFTYLLVLPLKWGYPSLVWILIKSNWQTIVISFIIYYSQVIFAKFVFFDRQTGMYDNRRLQCVWDYFLFFFNALLSMFTSLKRIVMSMVFGIIYLSRLDQCGMMRGFEKFDSGHKAFLAMLHVEVTQNNPTVLTFIELLSQGANRRAAAQKASNTSLHVAEGGKVIAIQAHEDFRDPKNVRRRWAINQWQKFYTLLNNHSLVVEQLSKHALRNLAIKQ